MGDLRPILIYLPAEVLATDELERNLSGSVGLS